MSHENPRYFMVSRGMPWEIPIVPWGPTGKPTGFHGIAWHAVWGPAGIHAKITAGFLESYRGVSDGTPWGPTARPTGMPIRKMEVYQGNPAKNIILSIFAAAALLFVAHIIYAPCMHVPGLNTSTTSL